ncbi:NACHT domain-containing protein (plasmid) [Azospirillum argentinense]|uniref:NACHT domain-containing protein n=2 Tax=Azospirillum TaxID=191 RepID=A0A4D8Q8L7_AZOBR|nr:NACHT domain-containing protein [Azospirillum argentinense]
MVTNRKFSADAHAAARGVSGVFLKQKNELISESVDFGEFGLLDILQYEQSEIFERYIPLGGRGRVPSIPTDIEFENIEESIFSWISSGKAGLLAILADFGSGKTTLMNRIKYKLLKKRSCQEIDKTPIMFELKDLASSDSLHEFVSDSIRQITTQKGGEKLFWRMLNEGRFVILLDGFDEISTNADSNSKYNVFNMLRPLLVSKSPTILTCRPTYFISVEEYNSILRSVNSNVPSMTNLTASSRPEFGSGLLQKLHKKYVNNKMLDQVDPTKYATLYLSSLNISQIESYLKGYDAEFISKKNVRWTDVLGFLFGIYDIKDFMSRPLLLSMIVDTILDADENILNDRGAKGAAWLYELYTGLQLDRDWEKGESRKFFSSRERQLFAQAIALTMLKEDKMEVSYSDVLKVARAALKDFRIQDYAPEIRHAEIATDIQVCAFMSHGAHNCFRFVHKSFMEFFVAQSVVQQLVPGNLPPALGMKLNKEIVSFVASYCLGDEAVRNKFLIAFKAEAQKAASRKNFAQNIARVLLSVSHEKITLNASSLRIGDVAVKNAEWERVDLRASVLHNFELCQSKLFHVNLEGNLSGIVFDRVEVWESSIEGDISNCRFGNCIISSGSIDVSASHLNFTNCDLEMNDISITGNALFDGGKIVDCKILSRSTGKDVVQFRKANVIRSIISVPRADLSYISVAGHEWMFHGCTFEHCLVLGLPLRRSQLKGITGNVHESGMRGIIVVTNEQVEGLEDVDAADGGFEVCGGGLYVISIGALQDPVLVRKLRSAMLSNRLAFAAKEAMIIDEFFSIFSGGGDDAVQVTDPGCSKEKGELISLSPVRD